MATSIGPATNGAQTMSTFTSMTLDIHILVLQYLDPPDILSLRKTCRTLLDATHQRIVWIDALTKICLENAVYLPSYPVTDMSTLELEYAASSPERWNRYIRKHEGKDFIPPSLTRTLQFPDYLWQQHNFQTSPFFMEQLYLVPGGRFLVTLMQGHIHVWDLGIAGIAEPKSEPIAEISSKGQWFSTHPSFDGEGLRIITSDHYFGCKSHSFEVFEIFPGKPDAKLKVIATLSVEAQHGLDFTSVAADLLILVYGPILKIWNFVTRGWATWNTGRPSKQTLATDKYIILIESDNLSVWDIPSLSYDAIDKYTALESDTVTQPRTRIPYPTGFGPPDPGDCAGLCGWYTGSSQPLWFDLILDSSSSNQVFNRFKINLDDLDLPTIPLSLLYSFNILQHPSIPISPYRICGDDISFLICDTDGIVLHAGSPSPDDSHHTFSLSRKPAGSEHLSEISFCPISGRLCYTGPRNIMITDYSPLPFKPTP